MDLAAKFEVLDRHVDKLLEEMPTKLELAEVLRETRATRRMLESHMDHSRTMFAESSKRQEAIMSMLGDLIGRLP